jgi:hypothetical protein
MVEVKRGSLKDLWQTFDQFLGRVKPPTSQNIDANEFSRFLDKKVAVVYSNIAGSSSSIFKSSLAGVNIGLFAAVTADDVINYIHRLPDKTSVADPLLAYWLKWIAVTVVPCPPTVLSCLLAGGQFPNRLKQTLITPTLQKAGLNTDDVRSYRPIPNLLVISKPLKRIVVH